MLIKLPEWLERNQNLKIPHYGKVVDNLDPKKLGRIKVEIKELVEGSPDKLPWSYPENPSFLGGNNKVGYFTVPEIGSEVIIKFPTEDIYQSFYSGYWHTSKNYKMSHFNTDYPETFGWEDSTGTWWTVNKQQKCVNFHHTSGADVKIDKDGNIDVYTPGYLHIVADKEINITSGKSISAISATTTSINAGSSVGVIAASTISIQAGGTMTLKAPQITEN